MLMFVGLIPTTHFTILVRHLKNQRKHINHWIPLILIGKPQSDAGRGRSHHSARAVLNGFTGNSAVSTSGGLSPLLP
jgi:hypothetical protein